MTTYREAIEEKIQSIGSTGGTDAMSKCLTAIDVIAHERWPMDPQNRRLVLLAVCEALQLNDAMEALTEYRRPRH